MCGVSVDCQKSVEVCRDWIHTLIRSMTRKISFYTYVAMDKSIPMT